MRFTLCFLIIAAVALSNVESGRYDRYLRAKEKLLSQTRRVRDDKKTSRLDYPVDSEDAKLKSSRPKHQLSKVPSTPVADKPVDTKPKVPSPVASDVKPLAPLFLSVHPPAKVEVVKSVPSVPSTPTQPSAALPDKKVTASLFPSYHQEKMPSSSILYDYYDGPSTSHRSKTSIRTSSKGRHRKSSDSAYCVDYLGNTKVSEPGRPDLFKLVVEAPVDTKSDYHFVTSSCAHGSFFNIKTCNCEVMPDDSVDARQCHIYLPFNENLLDHSIQRFTTIVEGTGKVNVERKTFAVGTGSARFDRKARLEIPGRLKTTTPMQVSATWCTFFRCEQVDNSYNCEENAGLLSSTYNDTHRGTPRVQTTFSLNVQKPNTVVAQLVYERQANVLEGRFNIKNGETGFVHVCVTHDQTGDKLYINKNIADSKKSHGRLLPVSGPYTIGFSPKSQHFFKGLIDDVLVCDQPMTPEEIRAHYDGNRVLLSTLGYIPQ